MEETFHRNGVHGVLHRAALPNGDGVALTHGAGAN